MKIKELRTRMYESRNYRLHKKLIMITRIKKKNISKRKTEWLGYEKNYKEANLGKRLNR